MGVEVGAPLPCDALHRLADVLGVVIVLVHDSGQACYGSTRARRWRAVVEVDGAGVVLHAVRAGLSTSTTCCRRKPGPPRAGHARRGDRREPYAARHDLDPGELHFAFDQRLVFR